MIKKHIAILGSTGSIGTQALNVIAQYPDRFELELLTANNNAELLISQALNYKPNHVVIVNEDKYGEVSRALEDQPVKVFAGCESIEQAVTMESIDMVLTALVGISGLIPTIRAIEAGKHIALANKETLVVAGEMVTRLALENRVHIHPVDSEHSAIFQCLVGEDPDTVEKIILTASGGPFRNRDRKFLDKVTPGQALQHPNWCMGEKVTIDSASLMNKGLEVIEAHWLFGLRPEQIGVVVHPQSIIHSIVQFRDGSMKAQMGIPDMKLPILYAFGYPDRLRSDLPRFSFADYPNLSFEEPDMKNFRNLALSFEALHRAGNIPCVLNASNEIAVQAFLDGRIGFTKMPDLIEKAMEEADYIAGPDFREILETDRATREYVSKLIG